MPSGLKYIEIQAGSGVQAKAGDVVFVHYTGTLENGKKFDSSHDRNEPIAFVLGEGQVIAGWDEGIAHMKVGGKARLVIPPELGYGAQGAGGVIPPNATLIFDVELVNVRAGAPNAPQSIPAAQFHSTASGLKYFDLQVGSGQPVKAGHTVSVHYTGWLENGKKFDSSLDRNQPFQFTVGARRVIAGWEEGLLGMQTGGVRQLVIPSQLGYGTRGAGGVIPPNATLVFEVELLEIR